MIICRIFIFLFLIVGVTTMSNAAAYMKLGDIKGEATDNEHKDWIIIESISSPLFTAHAGIDSSGQCSVALRSRGDTTLGDVVVVRELDKSSTKLQQAACSGGDGTAGYEVVIIDLVSSGRSKQEPYLTYKLTNVIVTSYSVGPGKNAAGETVPMESITLNYAEVEVEYVPQKDGKK